MIENYPSFSSYRYSGLLGGLILKLLYDWISVFGVIGLIGLLWILLIGSFFRLDSYEVFASFSALIKKGFNSISFKDLLPKKEVSESSKIIEDEYLDTIKNNRSKQRIPFGSLVELGVIKPGTEIYDQKKKVNAKIMVDGSIRYQKSEGSIHKVAAKILGAESCNGWTYWHYQSGNSLKPIDELRQRLRPKN